MADFNKVVLVGRLTRDPLLAYTPEQTPVVSFGLAINRAWTDVNEQRRQTTCFVECAFYGVRALPVHKYLTKGSSCLVEGQLEYQTWQAKGQTRSRHIVIVQRVVFMDHKRNNDSNDSQAGDSANETTGTP
ncbi:MAG: hypothetical protein A2Z25_09840 [Planctomycetes bacterium RBG_16_55_9]|jgi:single-strand DNA-binding protein|nr:MAG: hypothetical protein A2Z25_09840 [Planctomycetes bacterium RBG_16_55_9]